MIRRLRITGYKSLVDVDLTLAPLTVIFGPNAAGKSNLLDAISLLSAFVTEPSLDAAFQRHRGAPLEAFSFGPGGLEDLVDTETSTRLTMTADLELSDVVVQAVEKEVRRAREGLPGGSGPVIRKSIQERRLRYTVTIEIRTSSGHLRVMNERLEALRADWMPRSSRRPFLELDESTGRLHLRMERQAHPIYEELGQDRTVASKGLYVPHHPHLAALREEMKRWRGYFLEPSAMREEVPLKEVDTLAANGADIAAFYHSVENASPRQFEGLAKSLQLLIPSLSGLEVTRTKQGFVRLVVRESGMPISSRLMSEGTLRVLGLLAITNPRSPLSVVGFEEPENGIHPRRLSAVARILEQAALRGQTQFIVNTHSPILPTLFEGSNNQDVALVACRKDGRETIFEHLKTGPLLLPTAVVDALEDEPSSVGERILRGDFGG